MNYTPKPHVSAALAHLRHGVTACALVVVAAATLQMLIFGCVHFTQVRFQEVRHQAPPSLTVVSAPKAVAGMKSIGPAIQPMGPTTEPAAPTEAPGAAHGMPRLLSDADATLHVLSDMAVVAGLVATIVLAVLSALAVAVAGGASVPGVERVVGAAGYALLLSLICIPWRDMFSTVPFPGVFGGYEAMTEMSDAVDAGGRGLSLFTLYLLMPMAALVGSCMVLARFRAGVADGIIVTSVSELDDRLEREMAGIRNRGVAAVAPRSVAALNQAIGEKPEPPPESVSVEPTPRRIPGIAAPRPARNWLGRERRIGETDPGDPLKRPI